MENGLPLTRVVLALALSASSLAGCSKPEPVVARPMPRAPMGGEAAPPPAPVATLEPTEESPGTFTGVVTCGRPNRIPLSATQTEIVRFDVNLSVPELAAGDANPSVALVEGDAPVTEGENPVAITGAAQANNPVVGSRAFNVRRTGEYGLAVSVEQCVPVAYHVVVAREVAAVTNVTREAAAPISIDAPATGTFGCEDERWFAFDARAREKLRVSLSGASRAPGTESGATVTLENASGPVTSRGNPVVATATLAGEGTVAASTDVTIPRAGSYFLHLASTGSCGLSDYTLTLARR